MLYCPSNPSLPLKPRQNPLQVRLAALRRHTGGGENPHGGGRLRVPDGSGRLLDASLSIQVGSHVGSVVLELAKNLAQR